MMGEMSEMGDITEQIAGLILMVECLDADTLNFHAARYDSAEKFQRLIRDAQNGEVDPDNFSYRVYEIACATPGDGGDYLTIPCLGGNPLEVWQTICRYFREMLAFSEPFVMEEF